MGHGLGRCRPGGSGSPEMTGDTAGDLQDPKLSIKGACLCYGKGVLAASQALTQVQWCVSQPISLVGISPMVQEQLHWKQENTRVAVRSFYGLDPNRHP